MRKRLFTFCSAASLLLCVLIVALWVSSWRGGFSSSGIIGDQRLTLRSEEGRLTLFGPPARSDPLSEAQAQRLNDLVGDLSNEQVEWGYTAFVTRDGTAKDPPSPEVSPGEGAIIELWPSSRPELDPATVAAPLLGALESGDTFVAAHVLLDMWFSYWEERTERREDGTLVVTADGLEVILDHPVRDESAIVDFFSDDPAVVDAHHFDCTAVIDLTQRSRISDQWHRRLDQPRSSVSYGWLTGLALVLPSLWVFQRLAVTTRVRRRVRRGLCPICGYDLTGNTSGVCPECGTVIAIEVTP